MSELSFLRMAVSVQLARGYKASWVYVIFRMYFSKWPGPLLPKARVAEPMEPTLDFSEWLAMYQRGDFNPPKPTSVLGTGNGHAPLD